MAGDILETITKLIRAGEEAGYTLEQMIQLLENGMSLSSLMELVEWRLTSATIEPRAYRWVM